MNRSLVIVVGTLALGMVLFGGSYAVSRHVGERCLTQPGNDLAWLRQEFSLNDAEMARIQKLHEGYLPQCAEMCQKIAAKKSEVQAALGEGTNITVVARQKLVELGELRAQCQAQMLRHFIAVSQTMPPEQGRRYLAEMQLITLGLHEQTEQSMSKSAVSMHGHD